MSVIWKEGSIEESSQPKNIAGVQLVEGDRPQAGQSASYTITLSKELPIRNFTAGTEVIFNTKGTSNSNANNTLTVQKVIGPLKYVCSGSWPLNF